MPKLHAEGGSESAEEGYYIKDTRRVARKRDRYFRRTP